MERKTTTLYKKVGKRYVKHDDYLDEIGLPEGLYLFYKTRNCCTTNAMMSMLHYAKVHDIQNVGKFCDLYVAHHEIIADAIRKATAKDVQCTTNEMIMNIINELANIEL